MSLNAKQLMRYAKRQPNLEKRIVKSVRKAVKNTKIKRHKPRGFNLNSLIPPKKFTVMTWNNNVTLSTDATTINKYGAEYVFLLANINKPQFAGTTTSVVRPNGFDQVAEFYNKFRVYGVKITCQFYDPSSDGVMVACQFQPSNEGDSITGQLTQSQGQEKWCTERVVSNTGEQSWIYKRYVSLRRCDGLTRVQYECSDAYVGTLGTNTTPNTSPYLRFACANTVAGATQTIKCRIRLDYFVQVFGRKIMPSSAQA